jgi:serine/threonine-protein kinase
MRLQRNEQFAGYTVLRPLGRGGMAFVDLAEDSDQTRRVALKLLPEDVLGDAQAEARFQQEARTVMALEHPNIVPLYRHGIERGAPWMALRFVEGGDLAERLSRPLFPKAWSCSGRLPERRISPISGASCIGT